MVFQFVKTNILSKKLRNFLAIFSIAVSVILIIAVQNITEQLNSNILKNASYYDIIVGSAGSETQLILSTLFYYDSPIANIDIEYYENLQKDFRVKSVVPIGMGDNYAGYRIIGTKQNFFTDTENYKIKEGIIFRGEREVVLGSTVAKLTGLKLGDTFASTHGLTETAGESSHSHEDFKYTVVGILESTKTPNDTVIFTDIENLWHAHGLRHDEDENESGEHIHEEKITPVKTHGTSSTQNYTENSTALITALLVRSKGLNEQFLLTNELGKDNTIQAINPTAVLRKLLNTLDVGGIIVTVVAAIAVILSIIMLFTTMLSSSLEKIKDLSILRALGANRKTVFAIILLEALIIAVIGALIGFVVAHMSIGFLGMYTTSKFGLDVSMWYIAKGEIISIILTMLLSLIAGTIPGIMVYKVDAAKYIK